VRESENNGNALCGEYWLMLRPSLQRLALRPLAQLIVRALMFA
jgi:hypothetical protein